MKIQILKEIIKKKSSKENFAVLTNLINGNSEIFEFGKFLSKDFESSKKEIENYHYLKKNGIIDGTQNGKVYVETGFKEETVEKLAKLGHNMEADVTGHEREIFGRAQIITRDRETGVLCAGSDGRSDGCALGY